MSPAVRLSAANSLPDLLHFPFPSPHGLQAQPGRPPGQTLSLSRTFNSEAGLQGFRSLHCCPSRLLQPSQPKEMAGVLKASAFKMGHSSPEMFPNSAESLPGDSVTVTAALGTHNRLGSEQCQGEKTSACRLPMGCRPPGIPLTPRPTWGSQRREGCTLRLEASCGHQQGQRRLDAQLNFPSLTALGADV